jgi:hypothetical protein
MDETELIGGLQSLLESSLGVPVKTASLEDERPVPVVIIDDWDTRDMNFHNSAFAGEAYGDFDNDGSGEYERYLNFDFETRVEFLFRHSDEVDVSRLKEDGKQELRLVRENPQNFNSGLKSCKLGADGNPTHQFTEPKEAELMLSARFHGDHTITRTPSDTQYDTIQDVKEGFTFNPN